MPDTWIELAMAAGAKSSEEAELLLWSGSCYPFGTPRGVYYQIRHALRHQVCIGDPMATCPPWGGP